MAAMGCAFGVALCPSVMSCGLTLLMLSLAGFGLWLLSLPVPAAAQAQPVPEAEAQAMLASLKPPKRSLPLVAVMGFAATVLGNTMAFWQREQIGIALQPGMDAVSLALVADARSRTYRSKAVTFSDTATAVESRHGIRIIPDERTARSQRSAMPVPDRQPAMAPDQTLADIEARYGRRTADVVAMQLEYPGFHAQPGAAP